MKLIDTNIIMYSLGKPHPLRDHCREVLRKVAHGEVEANIDTEVFQELLYVYSSRGERRKALVVAEETLILFTNPFAITRDEVEKAKDLMKSYPRLAARDAIHCAVAMNYKLEGIISTDKDLKAVKEIRLFKP